MNRWHLADAAAAPPLLHTTQCKCGAVAYVHSKEHRLGLGRAWARL